LLCELHPAFKNKYKRMKTISVLFFCTILFVTLLPQSANGQWFNKQFGVENINDLTEDQVNDALQKANLNVKKGKIVTFIGLGFIASGSGLFIHAANQFNGPAGRSPSSPLSFVSGLLGGALLVGLGAAAIPLGIPTWIIGKNRISDVNKAFGNNLSSVKISPSISWQQKNCFVGAQITLSLSQ